VKIKLVIFHTKNYW